MQQLGPHARRHRCSRNWLVFFGDEPTGVDAIVFGALAPSVLTPIASPIRDFLRSQPACVAYAERVRARFFPELAVAA